jgi:drug/metabolite transporter (DMT)-like permease
VGYLIPLFSVVLGALILNEPVGPPKIIAAFFILLGLGLTQKAQAHSLVQR